MLGLAVLLETAAVMVPHSQREGKAGCCNILPLLARHIGTC